MSSAEGLKQRKGKKEEEKPLLDKEDKPKPVVSGSICVCVGVCCM
jgi:hypothetical protein